MGDFRKKYPVDWFRGGNFKIENKPIKDKSGKRKFKRMLRFLFVDKRELFAMKLSFEEFHLFFLLDGSERLACFEPTEAARFLKKLEVHSVLYGHRKYVFKSGIFVFRKVSWTFSTFWHRRERKPTKCAFEIDFLPCAQLIELASTDAGSS